MIGGRFILRLRPLLAAMALGSAWGAGSAAFAETLNLSASNVPPYVTPDGGGFEGLLARELYRRLGYDVSITLVPATRGLELVNDGVDDGMLARNPNMADAYPNLVHFSEHALTREYVVYTKRADVKPSGWKSLAPYSVGIVNGWKILERNIVDAASMTKVKNGEQLFRLLDEGRVDVAVFNRWGGLHIKRSLGLSDVRLAEPALARRDVFFYLHRRHAELAKRASDELREMKRDGTYDRIVEATLGPLTR